MTYDSTEGLDSNNLDIDKDAAIDMKKNEVKDIKVRQRIDDLLEKKRLKELLDDTDDW
ncbi:MAG: hypothetical protein KC484_08485 [Colwelliaceae bacterium]|jgi:hypothetical protein|nr:hypothetical protein [Colwelliaceae bacterium]